jgi:hypothetical protein
LSSKRRERFAALRGYVAEAIEGEIASGPPPAGGALL